MVYKNKKGAQGIGTLIIFIAMILVAAVAAGVLIQTSGSLQSKSLDVGRQSQEKITSDIEVVQVFASNTSDGTIDGGGSNDSVTLVMRLGSGSTAIKLGDLLIKVDTKTGSQTLQVAGSDGSGNASTTEYSVAYISNGATAIAPGYLSSGDLAQVTFLNNNAIAEGEKATIRLMSKNGAVKPVDLTAPSAMTQVTTYLYP